VTGLRQRLERLGAEDVQLLDWVVAREDDAWRAWDACARGDWRLWVAAAAAVPPRVLVQATLACVQLAAPIVPAGEPRPGRAVDAVQSWLQSGGDGSACAQTADAAEAAGEMGAYRAPSSTSASHAALASAWLARAADAAHTAEVRSSIVRASAEAGRLTQWMRAQTFFDALLPADAGALEHAVADDLAFVTAACAEAVTEVARALSDQAGGESPLDDALARCDRIVAEHIPRRSLSTA